MKSSKERFGKVVVFSWRYTERLPEYYINGVRYCGLISGRVYDRFVCSGVAGSISICENDLFKEC